MTVHYFLLKSQNAFASNQSVGKPHPFVQLEAGTQLTEECTQFFTFPDFLEKKIEESFCSNNGLVVVTVLRGEGHRERVIKVRKPAQEMENRG